MADDSCRDRIEHQFDAYIMKLIRNAGKDRRKKDAYRSRNEFFFEDLDHSKKQRYLNQQDRKPDTELFKVKGRIYSSDMIHEAIGRLSEDQVKIIGLSYFEDMTDEQIGNIMNASRRLTTYRRNRALEIIRKYLEEEHEEENE